MAGGKSSLVKSKVVNNELSKTWVLLVQNKILQHNEGRTPDIVKLKHPRTGIGAMFLFSSDDSTIQEIVCFSEKRSWFINDTVKEDGKIFISTPIDPLFLVLPILKNTKEEGKVMPLEDLFFDQKFPATQRLLKSVFKSVHLIGDRKGPAELNAWMYVEDKTMKWLIKKTEKVAKVLKEKQINVSGSATSKNFVKSVKDDFLDDKDMYIKCAHGLVSEYLTDDLSSKLFTKLGLTEDEEKSNKKRKSSKNEEHTQVSKKAKVRDDNEGDASKQEKSKVSNAKEKAMKKAASKSKCITSFFKKT